MGKSIGGLDALIARADANTKVIADWVAVTPWVDFLAKVPATRSNTSVCLSIVDPAVTALAVDAQSAFAKSLAAAVEKEGAGYDIAHYRDAPPGLRIWCGATVEAARRRGADAVARLGLRQDQGRAAEGGLNVLCRAAGRRRRVLPISTQSTGDIMAPRVLISDALSPAAVQIFRDRGVEVDFQPNLGKDKDKLAEIIGEFDGLAVRSATKVTAKILEQAARLKVIGRAGIGVDNVDIPAATAKGIIVMNTPFGNSITTAEHAITLMLALARQIPQADASTQAGKWEKNRFMGVEITGKTLGVIGCGNIGSIVADRAIGLKMKVIAYDPFLSPDRAIELGVEKVELADLIRRADFITLHTPLTEKTRNILGAEAIAAAKKGVRIVNCARGGLVDEAALRAALDSGHVAGRRLRRLHRGAGDRQSAVRPSQRGVHAASRRRHHRGAGERRAADRRADVGLSAARRHLQCGELPLDHRRGSAAAEAVRDARREARLVRRPAHRDRHQEGAALL